MGVVGNILYQFDANYAPYAGISIESLLKNNSDFEVINIFLLTVGTMKEDLDKIVSTVKKYDRNVTIISAKEIENKLISLNVPKYRGSYTTNFKLFLSDYIPKSVTRLLYLDCDTIIDNSILELFTKRMENAIEMVYDSVVTNEIKKIKNFNESDPYYNAGVILYDLEKWRNNNCEGKIVTFIKEAEGSFAAPDQDIINHVFGKTDIGVLDQRFNFEPIHSIFTGEQYINRYRPNVYYSAKEIDEASRNVVIYHTFRFLGEFPWNLNNEHPHTCYFDKYMYNSAWCDYKKKKSEISLLYKMEKIMYRVLPKTIFYKFFDFAFVRFQKREIKRIHK